MSLFAAVDWGTTRFRLWLMDGAGEVLAERRSDEGLARAVEIGFATVLERHLQAIDAPAHLPVVVCGMAGSRQGWAEARYLDLPAVLDELPNSAVQAPGAGRDVRILPGLAQRAADRPDVMRGEETQLLGLARRGIRSGLVCLPGTHSKWAELKRGTVTGFATFLTGELFALLSERSILSHAVAGASEIHGGEPAFLEAVASVLDHPERMTRELFSIRAAQLLDDVPPTEASARLSGLAIGVEIAGAISLHGRAAPVTLVASDRLRGLYGSALDRAGIGFDVVDADETVRAGLLAAASHFWPLGEERRRA